MQPGKTYVPVKIPEDVFRLVEAIATVRGVEVADYLGDIVRPVAERDHAKLSQLFNKVRLPDANPPA